MPVTPGVYLKCRSEEPMLKTTLEIKNKKKIKKKDSYSSVFIKILEILYKLSINI